MAYIYVSNSNELWSALSNAQAGDTILLAAGEYGDLYYDGLDQDWSEAGVKITSEDPENPAVFLGQFHLSNVENLTLEGFVIDADQLADGPHDPWVVIKDSAQITLSNMVIAGEKATEENGMDPYDPAATRLDPIAGYPYTTGLSITDVDGLTIEDTEFYDLRIALRLVGVTDAELSGLHLHDVREGINFTDVQDLIITESVFEDFISWLPFNHEDYDGYVHDHTDMIQFWAVGATEGIDGVTISDNIFRMPTDNDITQTILGDMTDAADGVTAQNFTITGNIIENAHPNAIRLHDVEGGVVEGNVLISNVSEDAFEEADQGWVPQINVSEGSSDILIGPNVWFYSEFSALAQMDPAELASKNIIIEEQIVLSFDPDNPNYWANYSVEEWRAIAVSGTGPAEIWGSFETDIILGSANDDTLWLRFGDDEATGYAGADKFIIDWRYVNNGDSYTIRDLDFARDDELNLRFYQNMTYVISDMIDLADFLIGQPEVSYTEDSDGITLTLPTDAAEEVSIRLDDVHLVALDWYGIREGVSKYRPAETYADIIDPATFVDVSTDSVLIAATSQNLMGGTSDDVLVGSDMDDSLLLRFGDDIAYGFGGADEFIIDWRYITSGDTYRVDDLDFGGGDWLTLRFASWGNLKITAPGDLQALYAVDGVSALVDGSDLKVTLLDNADNAFTLVLGGMAGYAPNQKVLVGGWEAEDLVGGAATDEIWLRFGDDTAYGGGAADSFIVDWRYTEDGESFIIWDLDFAEGDELLLRFLPGEADVLRIDDLDSLAAVVATDNVTADVDGLDLVLTLAENDLVTKVVVKDFGWAMPSAINFTGAWDDEVIQGGQNDDTLWLRFGDDTAYGSKGADTFLFDWRYLEGNEQFSVMDLSFKEGDIVQLRYSTWGEWDNFYITEALDLSLFLIEDNVTAKVDGTDLSLVIDDGMGVLNLHLADMAWAKPEALLTVFLQDHSTFGTTASSQVNVFDWSSVEDGHSRLVESLSFEKGGMIDFTGSPWDHGSTPEISSKDDLIAFFDQDGVTATASGDTLVLSLNDGIKETYLFLEGLGSLAPTDLQLVGGSGDNVLEGGAGADTLWMRFGTDMATGNNGADRFLFDGRYLSDETHVITDLNFGEGDTIEYRFMPEGTVTISSIEDLDAFVARADVSMGTTRGYDTLIWDVDGVEVSLILL